MLPPPDFDKALSEALAKFKPRTDEEIISIVERVLKDCGIDHSHWCEANEVKKDLLWLRDSRLRCEALKVKGLATGITALVITMLTMMALGIKEWFEHG